MHREGRQLRSVRDQEQHRKYQLHEYQARLKQDIGVDASEVRICVALKKLGQHRKGTSTKKIEGQKRMLSYHLC